MKIQILVAMMAAVSLQIANAQTSEIPRGETTRGGGNLPPMRPPTPPRAEIGPRPSAPTMSDLNRAEAIMLRHEAEFQAARQNSWEEQYAAKQRDQARARFSKILSDRQFQSSLSAAQMEQLAGSLESKFQAAGQNTAPEAMYRDGRTVAYRALIEISRYELQNADFQRIEREGYRYESLFQAAGQNTAPEQAYAELRTQAFRQAQTRFSQMAASMGRRELFQIQAEYERRYQAAGQNTAPESYAAAIRDIARARLN